MAEAKGGEQSEPSRKPLVWLHGEIKTPPFTPEGRQEVGALLRLLQEGDRLGMPLAEPLPDVGPRCGALRVRDAEHHWRIMYRIDRDAVLVVEVYPKKTRKIPKEVMHRCTKRLKQYDATARAAKRNPVDSAKRKALEAAGWQVGDAADFLEMSDEERQLLDTRVQLALAIRRQRKIRKLSQKDLATRLRTSQPRVAKIERAASDVSLDQLVRALTAAGGKIIVTSATTKPGSGRQAEDKTADTIVLEVAPTK